MIANVKSKVAGRYRLCVYRDDGSLKEDTGWFDNLILDQGLDQIGQVSNSGVSFGEPILWATGSVGTGSTAPATTDTQLEAWVATAGNYAGYVTSYVPAAGSDPAYWKCLHTYRFGAGAAAGNLTEVGVGITNYDGTGLFSRALIVDGGGSPTTLVVTSTEILDLTYEFRVYPDTTEEIQTLIINGTTYTFTWNMYQPTTAPQIYHAYINGSGTFSSCDVAITQTSSGGGGDRHYTPTSPGYSIGSYNRSYSVTSPTNPLYWGPTIGGMIIQTLHTKRLAAISPALPVTSVQKIAVSFNVSWTRFTP
jgi:hypothetical protein